MAGRPRSAEADAAILTATLEEYAHRGYGGLCVEAVAARAGVSKATIYRRYASKLDLVMAGTSASAHDEGPLPDTGSLRGDLIERLHGLREVFGTTGRVMRRLVSERGDYAELDAAHSQFIAERRAMTTMLVARAEQRGEIGAGADAGFVGDLIAGPLFYRFLVHDEIVGDAYIERVVDAALATLPPP
jgi:AcrR family transcriptional regulator